MTLDGQEACGFNVTSIRFGTPIGESSNESPERVYVRDLRPAARTTVARLFEPNAVLPVDASDTGYRQDGVELWLARDASFIYLVGPASTEAWPRSDAPPPGCI
jgi:hypothetical protein